MPEYTEAISAGGAFDLRRINRRIENLIAQVIRVERTAIRLAF
jgi:hypothetical protein